MPTGRASTLRNLKNALPFACCSACPTFVRRHGHRRDGGRLPDVLRQVQRAIARVVVVGQLPGVIEMLTTPRPPPALPTPAVSPLAARIRAATSAPEPLFAGTWLHFANQFFTQCSTQPRPQRNDEEEDTGPASPHHATTMRASSTITPPAVARSGLTSISASPAASQHVADRARGPCHRLDVNQYRAARSGQQRPHAQRPQQLRDVPGSAGASVTITSSSALFLSSAWLGTCTWG